MALSTTLQMAAHHAGTALLTADDGGITLDPTSVTTRVRAVVIGVIGVGLLIVSAAAVLGPGRKGNTRRSVDITVASIIALVPAVLGAAGIFLAFGAAVLGWAIPGISA